VLLLLLVLLVLLLVLVLHRSGPSLRQKSQWPTAAGRASPCPYRFPAGQTLQRLRRRSVPATRNSPRAIPRGPPPLVGPVPNLKPKPQTLSQQKSPPPAVRARPGPKAKPRGRARKSPPPAVRARSSSKAKPRRRARRLRLRLRFVNEASPCARNPSQPSQPSLVGPLRLRNLSTAGQTLNRRSLRGISRLTLSSPHWLCRMHSAYHRPHRNHCRLTEVPHWPPNSLNCKRVVRFWTPQIKCRILALARSSRNGLSQGTSE
jgi:hypothetical protein